MKELTDEQILKDCSKSYREMGAAFSSITPGEALQAMKLASARDVAKALKTVQNMQAFSDSLEESYKGREHLIGK